MNENLFHIDILGTQISFKSRESREYMEQIISLLKKRTTETHNRLKVDDPLKVSILTSLFLIDDLMKGSENSNILIENKLERLVQNLTEALE